MTARTLFIGNSYTSRNQLPRIVAALAAAAEQPIAMEVESIVAGGASLRRHWNAGVAQRTLAGAHWDHVVLQEQSTLPVKNAARYHDNVRRFAAEIGRHGARTVLYLNWSRRQAPQAQQLLNQAVEAIAREIGAQVVPVGPLWHHAMQRIPGIALYTDDGSHPTAIGSYLAACAFLVALFDQKPHGFAVAESVGVDRAMATELHELAWASRVTA